MGKKKRDEVREKEGRWKKRKGETLRKIWSHCFEHLEIFFKDKL